MSGENLVTSPECLRENGAENTIHWSTQMREVVVFSGKNGCLHAVLQGGASDDSFCYVASIEKNSIRYESRSEHFREGDIILEVQGEKVGGFVLQDLLDLIWSVFRGASSVVLKVTSEEFLPRRLTTHLNVRFNKDSLDHQLQQTIRRNIYKKALPYTTRPPRDDEVDGVDYKFLSVEEFLELERSGKLLEKGIYEGNYYGTPKPDVVVSHIIPWNGLPEQLYSMVNKQSASTTTTAAASVLVATKAPAALSTRATATAVTTRATNARYPSLTPSPLSSDSSANTTLLSPLRRLDHHHGTNFQSTARDNDDAMNNNNNYNSGHNNNNNSCNISDNKLKSSPNSAQPVVVHEDARETPNSIEIESSTMTMNHAGSIQNGQLISTVLVKSSRGLGFTIVGVEDEETGGVWLVVKTIMPGGPADADGKLQRGDILVQVNEKSVCGMSHGGVVQMFRQFEIDQKIAIQVIRTPYSANFDLLDADPCDPMTEVITTVAVSGDYPSEDEFYRTERLGIHIVKGKSGFGFTLADRPEGQKVKQLVDVERCRGLEEGDLLLEINDQQVRELPHADVVRILKSRPVDKPAKFIIERRVPVNVAPPFSGLRVDDIIINNNINYHNNSPQVCRPASAMAHGRAHHRQQQLYPHGGGHRLIMAAAASSSSPSSSPPLSSLSSISNRPETATPTLPPPQVVQPTFLVHQCSQHTPDFIPASAFSQHRGRGGTVAPDRPPYSGHGDAVTKEGGRSVDLNPHYQSQHPVYQYQCSWVSGDQCSNAACKEPHFFPNSPQQQYLQPFVKGSSGGCFDSSQSQQHLSSCESLHLHGSYHHFHSPVMHTRGLAPPAFETQNSGGGAFGPHGGPVQMVLRAENLRFVNLKRSQTGFGFRIVGGREEGTQVSIGYIVPSSPAHLEGSLRVGQEIFTVDGRSVVGAWHKDLVDLVTVAGQKGEITIGVRDADVDNNNDTSSNDDNNNNNNCHDVVLTRGDEDGFGFYILSSSLKTGSIIGQIIPNSPASRVQELKVGDEIRAINGCPIDSLGHARIVELIKSSGKTIKLTVKDSRASSDPQKVLHQPDQYSPDRKDDLTPRAGSALNCASAGQVTTTNNHLSNSPDRALKTPAHLSSSYSFPPPPSIAFSGSPVAKFERPEASRTPDDVVVLQVELARGQKGFGFSIRGGHEFNSLPMYVLKVADEGPARADGRLQAGDEILKINGRDTAGMTHKEAINIVQSSVHRLNLTVRRFVSTEVVEDL